MWLLRSVFMIPVFLVSTVTLAQTTEATLGHVTPVVIRAPGTEGSTWYISGGAPYEVFEAMGYAVASDRLAQMELGRLQFRGALSEVFPGINLEAGARAVTYSDHELQEHFESLDADYQIMVRGYVDGINQYLAEVEADQSPLPVELWAIGMSQFGEPLIPAPWTVNDVIAWVLLRKNDTATPLAGLLSKQDLIEVLAGAYAGEYLAMVPKPGLTEPMMPEDKRSSTSASDKTTQTAKADYWLGGTGSDIYYSAGDVGIGTSTPNSVLHARSPVNSIILFETTGAICRAAGIVPEGVNNRINFIGYTDPAVATVETSMGGFQIRVTEVNPNALKTKIRLLHNAGDNLVEALTVADDSNVGIGTTIPGSKLTVNGTIESTSGGVKFPDGTTQTSSCSGFGSWETKSANTTYLAETDGFVTAYVDDNDHDVIGYTDASDPPTTIRTRNATGYYGGSGVSFPVKKGDYWKVEFVVHAGSANFYVFWMPMGS